MDNDKKDRQWTRERFRVLREALNRSQHEMAVLVGVTERTIFRWEKGLSDPRRKMIRRLEGIERKYMTGQAQPHRSRVKEYEKNRIRFEEGQARFRETVRTVEESLKMMKHASSGSYMK